MTFYLDVQKTSPNWKYYLRLRKYPEQEVGLHVATFNPYLLAQSPRLAEEIVKTLNEQLTAKHP